MPKLEIRSGKAAGQVVELTSSTITLGNRRNATVELKDPWVSFNHAKITREGDRYFLADMRSKAGTFLNQKRLDAGAVPLTSGDRIGIGRTEITFVGEATAPAASPQAAASAAPGSPLAAAEAMRTPAPSVPVELLERLASLERDLALAQKDAKGLREAHVTREKLLGELNTKLRAADARATAAEKAVESARADAQRAEAARAEAAAREIAAREAATRALAHPTGAAAPTGPGASPAEIARYRAAYEELRARYDDVVAKGKARIDDLTHRLEAAQKAQTAPILAPAHAAAPASHDECAAELARVKKKLEGELKAYETALEERNKDVERLEAALEKAAATLAEAPTNAGSDASTSPGSNETETAKIRQELTEKTKRIEELTRINTDLRSQLEEINQDMLEQEEELRGELAELERKLQEATQPGRTPG